jgi:hypothetical protein
MSYPTDPNDPRSIGNRVKDMPIDDALTELEAYVDALVADTDECSQLRHGLDAYNAVKALAERLDRDNMAHRTRFHALILRLFQDVFKVKETDLQK